MHLGHVRMILETQRILSLDELRLLPCHRPPHRNQPELDSRQRLELLRLAVENLDRVLIDDRELRREGPSYTVDTLQELRSEFGEEVSLILLIGSDAYADLTHWYQWPKLPVLANIAVFSRPGYPLPKTGILSSWLESSRDRQLKQQPAGIVTVLNQVQLDFSATEVRRQLAAGKMPEELPPAVRERIKQQHYYGYKERHLE